MVLVVRDFEIEKRTRIYFQTTHSLLGTGLKLNFISLFYGNDSSRCQPALGRRTDLFAHKKVEQTGQNGQRKVLEGQRRPVEEFGHHQVAVLAELSQRYLVSVESVVGPIHDLCVIQWRRVCNASLSSQCQRSSLNCNDLPSVQ